MNENVPNSAIDSFFRYEGVRLNGAVEGMSDAERLLLWLRVNGFKVVPLTHLDCDE